MMSETAHRPADRTSGLRALSKITPPVPTRITPNARLHARLDGLRERAVVWVHGLPGAGKTSLVAGWLAARGIAPLWYRLDEGDGDPASFFAFLGRAAAGVDAEIAAHLPRPSPQQALSAFARSFFQMLFSHGTAPVLVFDDYHEIDATSATHALVATGLAEAPPGVTVVVVSRAGPPPDFARLRANGRLAMIGPEELRLAPAEARALVQDRDARVPAASVEAIAARTDGWAAGLVLILEAIEAGGGALPCPGSTVPEAVFDYFAGEVFRRMDAAGQEQLLGLGQLPAMTAEIATRLTGSADAAALLDRLVRRSYFTTRDAQEPPSYRFHPLFQDFLRTTARTQWPAERLDAVRTRAAGLLEDSGQPEAALNLIAETGDEAALVEKLLRWAPVFEREGRSAVLSTWLARLSPERIAGDGWLSYWAGTARMGSKPAESGTHFARASALFEETGDTLGQLIAWLAQTEAVRFDPFSDMKVLDRFIAELPDILNRLPSPMTPELELRVCASMYSALERRIPNHPERETWRERALDLARLHGQGVRFEQIAYGAVLYDLTAGRLAEARRRFEALPPPASLERYPFTQQLAYFAQAYLQAEKHAPGAAADTAREALDAAHRSGTSYWLHYTLAMAAHSAQNRDDLADCERWLATIRANVDPASLERSGHNLAILARSELMAGRIDAALRTAQTAVARAEASGWHISFCRAVLAEVLQLLGRWDEADYELHTIEAICARGGPQQTNLSRWLLLANACFAHGNEAEGLAALDEALRLARRLELRALRSLSALSAQLLARAITAGIEVDYAGELVRLNTLMPPDPDVEAWPWPLKITTFGGLAIRKDDAPLAFGRKTPRRLIELLKAIIAFGGTDVPEAQIVDALWAEEEGDAARQSFTVAIHRLRKLLGDPRFVLVTGGRVGLNPALCWLDLWSFERLLGGATAEQPATDRRKRALPLYGGDFLAGDEALPWTAPRREQTRRRYARACADHAERQGSDATLAIYRRGIEVAPTAEPLYRGLMACHRDRGERAEGMAVYRQLETVLAEATGGRPAPESVALNRALAGQ